MGDILNPCLNLIVSLNPELWKTLLNLYLKKRFWMS